MSLESMAVAMHHSASSGTARLVLLGVANHDGDGGSWPSVRTLARYGNVDPRNVQRHIKTLVDLGEVERVVQGGGNRDTQDHARPNLYRFLLECPDNCDRSRNHRLCRRCGDERFRDRFFICTTCKAVEAVEKVLAAQESHPVDNHHADPLAEPSPPGGAVTPPLAEPSPPPLAEPSPEPYLEESGEIGSPPDVTSPGRGDYPQRPELQTVSGTDDDAEAGPGLSAVRAKLAARRRSLKEPGSARAFDQEGASSIAARRAYAVAELGRRA